MINCEAGQHGPIQTRIIESATCVNVDEHCRLCGVRVATVSYIRDEWQRRQTTRKQQQQPELFDVGIAAD